MAGCCGVRVVDNQHDNDVGLLPRTFIVQSHFISSIAVGGIVLLILILLYDDDVDESWLSISILSGPIPPLGLASSVDEDDTPTTGSGIGTAATAAG